MQRFIQRHQDRIVGVLEGFDRLVLRGALRAIAYAAGMAGFLKHCGVDLANFDHFVHSVTARVIEASLQRARQEGRPITYLQSSRARNQQLARDIAARDKITRGLVCILRVVEPCLSFDIRRGELGGREVRVRRRKCQHLYHYLIHPRFGLLHLRLQTWFPFNLQIWINGREWLARDLDRAGIRYERADNCFPEVADFPRAQRLMRRHVELDWPTHLRPLVCAPCQPAARPYFPRLPSRLLLDGPPERMGTDVNFKSPSALAQIYPQLLHHGITDFSSSDVMRFLGGKVTGRFRGQIVSDFKDRPEGFRLRHNVGRNSVKLYDKHGVILRTETTIDDPVPITVFRSRHGDPHGPKTWRPLRKAIADLPRRVEVSEAANHRYLDALAAADTTTPVGDILARVARPIIPRDRRRIRGLRPWDPQEIALLQAVAEGGAALHGFANRDIRRRLFCDPGTKEEHRRQSAKVSRLLAILRAHGIIRKLGNSHRYTLTVKGQLVTAAVLTTVKATLQQL